MRTAIVLFNLGGPDGPDSVAPFLFNLFNDPAIITVPQPIRWLLARYISKRRAPIAQEIYRKLGGGSPLVANTRAQAVALAASLSDIGDVQCFVCMRYWKPRCEIVVQEVKAYNPDRIVLLPLYPQYSSTTTGSSFKEWRAAAQSVGLNAPTSAICCYPQERGFVVESAARIRESLSQAENAKVGTPRLLFSAHGLPKKFIDHGDPYQRHVELSAKAIVDELDIEDLDWRVCYQSRVGPLQWIGPSTEDEIARAANDGVPVVIVPIAFVSEHSETLVELDIEYRELADQLGVCAYHRVATVGTEARFIGGLKNCVDRAMDAIKAGDKGEAVTISCSEVGGACAPGVVCCPLSIRK